MLHKEVLDLLQQRRSATISCILVHLQFNLVDQRRCQAPSMSFYLQEVSVEFRLAALIGP